MALFVVPRSIPTYSTGLVPEHHGAGSTDPIGTHHDRLHHLVDEEGVFRAEVGRVERGCRHAGIVGLAVQRDETKAKRRQAVVELALEVADLVGLAARRPDVARVYRSLEHPTQPPALDREVDQQFLGIGLIVHCIPPCSPALGSSAVHAKRTGRYSMIIQSFRTNSSLSPARRPWRPPLSPTPAS